ncbi:Putative DNA-binding protein HU-beta (ACLAME 290) [hydrothermal vent metagenome]|uniref:Viral histone-like protein n=1 Tax=hydrothermal vent metagenome TaxID=652676 RepID=A0A3B0QNJ1_9ZZZZ
MAKPMTKSEVIEHLAKKTGLTKKDVNTVLGEFTLLAYKQAKNDFTIPGIGKLSVVRRKARKGRNPQTGEDIKIPAKNAVKFKVAKACKDAVVGCKK